MPSDEITKRRKLLFRNKQNLLHMSDLLLTKQLLVIPIKEIVFLAAIQVSVIFCPQWRRTSQLTGMSWWEHLIKNPNQMITISRII